MMRGRVLYLIAITLITLSVSSILVAASSEASVPQSGIVKGRVILTYRQNNTNAVRNSDEAKAVFKNMKIMLTGNNFRTHTIVSQDGSFAFYNVAPGSYLLEVASVDFTFPMIRVDVNKKFAVRARYLDDSLANLPYPLVIKPESKIQYFQVPGSMLSTVYSLLTSPMVLFAGVMMVMTMFMQNIDIESLKEQAAAQAGGRQDQSARPLLERSLPELLPSFYRS